MPEPISYLGDAVYVKYDGSGFKLMTASHDLPEEVVYLEPDVLRELIKFAKANGFQE